MLRVRGDARSREVGIGLADFGRMSEAKQPAAVDVVDSDNEDLSISHIWKKNKLPVKEELDSDDDEGTLLSTLRKKKVTKKSAKEEVIDSDEEIPIAALKVPKKRKIKLEVLSKREMRFYELTRSAE